MTEGKLRCAQVLSTLEHLIEETRLEVEVGTLDPARKLSKLYDELSKYQKHQVVIKQWRDFFLSGDEGALK